MLPFPYSRNNAYRFLISSLIGINIINESISNRYLIFLNLFYRKTHIFTFSIDLSSYTKMKNIYD